MRTKPEWARLADALESSSIGCTCHALYYGECGCNDAVWPEMSMKPAAAELRRLGQENTKQAEQIKAVTHLVTQLHQSNGHYRDRAMLSLFEAFGLNDKPEKTK